MRYYYTDKEYKELLKHLQIIATTNEQRNEHILSYFDLNKIPYRERKLANGDYNFCVTACPDLGFSQDTYFTDELFIERKNSLTELASSINNEAFHYELKRSRNIPDKFLLVEQANGWEGLIAHDYKTEYSEKAFYKTLRKFQLEYGLNIDFCEKSHMGYAIYTIAVQTLNKYILRIGV